MKSRLIPLLLAGILSIPAFATDYYIGDNGVALTVDAKGGRTAACFNLGGDSFQASGIRKGNKVTLDKHDDSEMYMENARVTLSFADNLVHVAVISKDAYGFSASQVKGTYHLLNLKQLAPRLRSQSRDFAYTEKAMNASLSSLLAVTPADQQQSVKDGQAQWMSGIDQRVQTSIMYGNLPEQKNAAQTVAYGYATVLGDRAAMLKVMTKQAKNPQYVPSLKGTLSTCYGNPDAICLTPTNHHMEILVCQSDTPACAQADKVLEGDMDATAKVTGRLEPAKGFVQKGLKIKAVK